eukprot:9040833-Pyramimonas_sp.AAC.1
MSAVGEGHPSPVAVDGYANDIAEGDIDAIVRDRVNGAGADLCRNPATTTARNTAGLTCATAAGRRRVPRAPL